VNQKSEELEKFEAEVRKEGSELYGADYAGPGSAREVSMEGTTSVENLAVTVVNEVRFNTSQW
jgi:hypothetical protein